MATQFIHLNIHTEFSIQDSLVRIDELIKQAVEHKMPALAITDLNNLFALVKFYRKAIAAGIKPIIGADMVLVRDNVSSRVTLLCQDQGGYHNLTELISLAYLEGQQLYQQPAITWQWLQQRAEGLIALSGNINGDIGQALLNGKEELAYKHLQEWQQLFPERFYLEISKTARQAEAAYLPAVLKLAEHAAVPVVATNVVRFMQANDFEAHEARVCIQSGNVLSDQSRERKYTDQQYFRSSAEMQALFADIPSALENSVLIAKRCNLSLELGEAHLPKFPLPAGISLEKYIHQQAEQGLMQRLAISYPDGLTEVEKQNYTERLEIELTVINRMGFPGYFLIVADFISWAKSQHIPVGPGRGSGAGSLVAYALGITELDPLVHELLFERFLNPERVSMPDFDIDFCMEKRDRVIEYVAERYGREAVSQIITFGTMAAKAVVRDVGRVLSLPYGFVDKVAKAIPFELGITLTKALAQEESLRKRYQSEEEVTTLIDLARKLEGLTRN
ncbi:MAG: DNA polymerase III subunit alpha, partial [Gammaproteobacteria bacterium]|nr:DNA polymerase III subunit alpha [Gammaproteobacteria bacterium]